MGCACLRGDGHHWADRGAGRVAAERRQQGGVAHQSDAAGANARAQLLRQSGNADAIGLRHRVPHPNTVSDSVSVGKPVSHCDHERLGDALSIAVGHGVDLTVGKRQRETVGLALAPA